VPQWKNDALQKTDTPKALHPQTEEGVVIVGPGVWQAAGSLATGQFQQQNRQLPWQRNHGIVSSWQRAIRPASPSAVLLPMGNLVG
jgi:hypothetical protein